MDGLGCISFLIDNFERVKRVLAQLDGNLASISRQTRDLTTALDDLQDVLQELGGSGKHKGPPPAGLEKDLERFKDRLVDSTEALILLQGAPTASKNLWKKVVGKTKLALEADQVAAHLARIDQEVQAISRRFSTKWTALIRLQVAEQNRAITEGGLGTKQGLASLQNTLQQLILDVKDVKRQDLSEPSEEQASEAYLRYRSQKLHDDMEGLDLGSVPQFGVSAQNGASNWTAYPTSASTSQQRLDDAIDALASCSLALTSPGASQEDILSSMDRAIACVWVAHMRLEAQTILARALSLVRLQCKTRPSEEVSVWLARLLMRQAFNQAGTNATESATQAGEEAVQVARSLFTGSPGDYRSLLSEALHWLQWVLTRSKNYKQALTVAEESLEHARAVVQANPAPPDSYLARRLKALGEIYSRAHAFSQAVMVTREALRLEEKAFLAHPSSPIHTHFLAIALFQVAYPLQKLGLTSEALEHAVRGVSLQRKAAASLPKSCATYLPEQLRVLAGIHYQLEQYASAMACGEESIRLLQGLVAEEPVAFHRDALIMALMGASKTAAKLGKSSLAINLIYQGVTIARQSPDTDSTSEKSHGSTRLAELLSDLFPLYSKTGQSEAGLVASTEAEVVLRQRVIPEATDLPATARATCLLGTCLWFRSRFLLRLDRPVEALASARECLSVYRRAASSHPGQSLELSNIREGLQMLCACHEAMDQHEEVTKVRHEIDEMSMQVDGTHGE